MIYIVMPIEDAKLVFTEEELSTMRKSLDNASILVHEEILIKKRTEMGLVTLPSEDTGLIEWTYPTYVYNSIELNELLNSNNWSKKEEI